MDSRENVARARKNPHPRSASGGQPSQQGKPFAKKSFGNNPARGPRENPPGGLKQQILAALADRAMDKIELSKAIGLPPDSRGKLRDVLSRHGGEGRYRPHPQGPPTSFPSEA